MTTSTSHLLRVPEFERLSKLLSGDNDSTAGISDKEIKFLSWLASQVESGDIVEIGSHRGKSIVSMACGVKAAGNLEKVRLFAIDLWTKGVGKTFDHYSSQETWRIFNETVAAFGFTDKIRPVMAHSTDASRSRRRPIQLLFIDASHTYKNVKNDFVRWEKFVPIGGRIAFHDYGTRFTGIDYLIDKEIIPTGKWDEFIKVDRIWSAIRRKT